MEVTVEYYDENVKAFNPPEWPGGFKAWAESLPKMDRQTPHRMTYSAQYLSLFECSMSPYDNIAHVKAALIKSTPFLSDSLAVGRAISKMTFCGQILEDGMILSDAQVRIGRQDGRLVGNEFIQVHTTPIVRVKLRTDLLLLHLAEWDPAVVTAADLKQALAQQHGISGSSSRLLRRYPQARPMLIKNEQQLYGFAGEVDRGRYLRKPYPGAFHGCGNTTPPGLVLEVITNEQAQHYEKEEEWWQQLESQPGWVGHYESPAGDKEPMTVILHAPLCPTWIKVAWEGSKDVASLHTCSKKRLHLEDAKGRPGEAVIPYKGFGIGQATIADGVSIAPVAGWHYLPTPKEMRQADKHYEPYTEFRSFGEAILKLGSQGQPIKASYVLDVCADGKAEVTIRALLPELETPSPELRLTGALSQGLTQCHYIRGLQGVQWSAGADTTPSLTTPFCLFQLTPSNTVPDVVTSPMGKRYANIRDRCALIIFADGTSDVRYADKPMSLKDLMTLVVGKPCLILGQFAFKQDQLHRNQSLMVLWNIDKLAQVTVPFGELKEVASGFDQIIKAASEEDLTAQTADYGQLYGMGPDITQGTRHQDAVLKPDKAAMPPPSERDQLRLQAVAFKAQEKEEKAVAESDVSPQSPVNEGDEAPLQLTKTASERRKQQQPKVEAKGSKSKRKSQEEKRSKPADYESQGDMQEGIEADDDFGAPSSRSGCLIA